MIVFDREKYRLIHKLIHNLYSFVFFDRYFVEFVITNVANA